MTAALSLAVFAIVQAPEVGWADVQALASLGAAAALLGIFVRLQATRREPLMPLHIWRAPNLAAANVAMALLGAAWIPAWFFLNLYLQQILAYGPLEGGAALLPMTVTIMVLMVGITARVVGRLGFKTPLVAGLMILAAGIGWLSFVPVGGSFLANVLPATLVAATGMSLAYIPAMLTALAGARPEEGGLAAGIVNTTYQVGSALGLAAMTALATAVGFGGSSSPVSSFQAAFIGAALVALVGAGLASILLREPTAAPAPAVEPTAGHDIGETRYAG